MNKQNIIGAIAVIALLLGAWASWTHPTPPTSQSNVVVGNVAGGAVSPTGVILPNPTAYDFLESRVALLADSQLMLGGATVTTGIDRVPSIGSCGTATSTKFSIANPFNATSTARVTLQSWSAQPTSTDLRIGTTTASTGLTTSNTSANLISATIPTSSPTLYIESGITTFQGGFTTSNQMIEVGPSERLGAFATTTYGSAGAVNYTQGTCVYKIEWKI